jgi:hypothetical protein
MKQDDEHADKRQRTLPHPLRRAGRLGGKSGEGAGFQGFGCSVDNALNAARDPKDHAR